MTTPLAAALRYADLGWPVIPTAPGGKNPLPKQWQNVATVDPATIAAWWAQWPDAGVGLATGHTYPTPEGEKVWRFVVDIDTGHHDKQGAETLHRLELEHGELPATVEAVSARGGRHLWFTAPVEITNGMARHLGPDLDVRGSGGQVLAWPTRWGGGQYQWLSGHAPDVHDVAPAPAWLVELLTTPDPNRESRITNRESRQATGDLAPGEAFNQATTWPQLLEPDSWQLHHTDRDGCQHWTRPGKDKREGTSATVNYADADLLKVFTSSVPWLQVDATYTRFGYHTARHHDGDHSAAAAALRKAGYGGRDNLTWVSNALGVSQPSDGPLDAPNVAERPTVVVNGRHLDTIVAEIVDHLHTANTPPSIFVRAGTLVRIRPDEDDRPLIETLDREHLRLHATHTMRFVRRNRDGEQSAVIPELAIFSAILRLERFPFPALAAVTETLVITPHGNIHTDPGYEPLTRLYHWPTCDYPPIPSEPTPTELAAAVTLIDEMLGDFPFDTSADRANTWALLLTPLVRPLIAGAAPMAVLDAPQPNTGKSLLAETVATVATGRTVAMQPIPRADEEIDKRITTMLLAGATMIAFDNIEDTLRSPALAAALTADTWQGRILGRSERVEVPNRATWMATGNNVRVGGDLARRCYRIRLDAHMADPAQRDGTYTHEPLLQWVQEHRGPIVAALATIVRSWWTAGQNPAPSTPKLGSYSPWARTLAGILHHAGVDSFLANNDSFRAEADADAAAWEAWLTAWRSELGDRVLTAAELTRAMETDTRTQPSEWDAPKILPHPMRDTLPNELVDWWGTPRWARRLGEALARRAGRHYGGDGLHVVMCGQNRSKVTLWSVGTAYAGPESVERGSLEHYSPAARAEKARGQSYVKLEEPQVTELPRGPRGQAPHQRVDLLHQSSGEENIRAGADHDPADPATTTKPQVNGKVAAGSLNFDPAPVDNTPDPEGLI